MNMGLRLPIVKYLLLNISSYLNIKTLDYGLRNVVACVPWLLFKYTAA